MKNARHTVLNAAGITVDFRKAEALVEWEVTLVLWFKVGCVYNPINNNYNYVSDNCQKHFNALELTHKEIFGETWIESTENASSRVPSKYWIKSVKHKS